MTKAASAGGAAAADAGPARIEDYALIGDCTTAALVSRAGSIDWLCWPRFDSAACFAALLGTPDHGRWLIGPADVSASTRRSYRDGSITVETVFATDGGEVALIDFMPVAQKHSSVVRIVEGRRGRVAMTMSLALRFDYGSAVPWVRQLGQHGEGLVAIAGPDMVVLRTPVRTEGRGLSTGADFTVAEGDRLVFTLTHAPSHLKPPRPFDGEAALRETEAFWSRWSSRGNYRGRYESAVKRSLLTLKALTYHPTGGIVAAATTSLPEQLGGGRNWDYRFCWLRDATLTLLAFMQNGYYDEAQAWRDWLHRSVAGSPDQTQIMYGIAGERRLDEWEVPWLPGYQGAAPVRIGNAASGQLQLDIFGEVLNALHQSRVGGLAMPETSWELETALVEHLAPDLGPTRPGHVGKPRRPAAVHVFQGDGLGGAGPGGAECGAGLTLQRRWIAGGRCATPSTRLSATAASISEMNSFVQVFGGKQLDASLLLIPMMGFLPIDDPRVTGTVAAIEAQLMPHGFVLRYDTSDSKDGLVGGEGAFLACSFWLAYVYARQGRTGESRRLFERLLGLCNDVGLLSEEYDPEAGRQTGNFPQAFSHVSLIGTALALRGDEPTEAPAQAQATRQNPATRREPAGQ